VGHVIVILGSVVDFMNSIASFLTNAETFSLKSGTGTQGSSGAALGMPASEDFNAFLHLLAQNHSQQTTQLQAVPAAGVLHKNHFSSTQSDDFADIAADHGGIADTLQPLQIPGTGNMTASGGTESNVALKTSAQTLPGNRQLLATSTAQLAVGNATGTVAHGHMAGPHASGNNGIANAAVAIAPETTGSHPSPVQTTEGAKDTSVAANMPGDATSTRLAATEVAKMPAIVRHDRPAYKTTADNMRSAGDSVAIENTAGPDNGQPSKDAGRFHNNFAREISAGYPAGRNYNDATAPEKSFAMEVKGHAGLPGQGAGYGETATLTNANTPTVHSAAFGSLPTGNTTAAGQTTMSGQMPQPVAVNTMAVHIAQQVGNGNRQFEIRLDPPELGRVEVRMDVSDDGKVRAHLVIERTETMDLLQRDARALERSLNNAGLDTGRDGLTFSLKDQGAGHFSARSDEGTSNDEPHFDDEQAADAEDKRGDSDKGLPDQRTEHGRLLTIADGLDIRI
jgi:flagellar hook-length control protein FliK